VGPGAGLFRAVPNQLSRPSSPFVNPSVRGHDWHARLRCRWGWRDPRELPSLQSKLRSHGQGGWALCLALGIRGPALRDIPP
jgi:hypothetical protein